MTLGIDAPVATLEEAQAYPYTEEARAVIRRERARAVIGRPLAVKERLLALREQHQADELMVITITGDYGSRLRSYELLAEAFGLQPPASG
jgi:alkanesulfonate monooxygenase SsuD/methylene tetrahydromethanopterin reductase-like flavin-dependent oxidoreductase (luciferase family)